MQILDLSRAGDISLAGGKAVNLSLLMQADVNVPDGFVITTSATIHWNKNLSTKILERFDELNLPYVAVRSSATSEDGKENSWAGQFDTYLFVDRSQLVSNIKKCIASTRSIRSAAYRRATNNNKKTPKIAVIVQSMVPAEVSGVCFSIHPVTQRSDQLVIEAAYGLGESVVSGSVIPDTYIVSRQTHKIISKNIAHQIKFLDFVDAAGGMIWEKAAHPSDQKLSDSQIKILASEVESIEALFGFPVDVEWVLYKNKFYILQSRPITTLG